MLRIPPRAVRVALIAAVVVGIGVDAFFAIVNFYPVAPHPNRGPKRYIVMQLDPVQAAWFQANILDDFNNEQDANLELLRVDDEEQLQAVPREAARAGKDVVLVALPATQTASAIHGKLVRPFTDVASAKQIASDFAALGDPVLGPSRVGNVPYFLPRMQVIDVAVYRVSKVRDAVLHWSALRPQIDAALAKVNGHGLPAGYELRVSPGSWDSYDLFVMAYYWAHRRYQGQPARPRVAHRTGDEIDGQRDIVAGIYRIGGTDQTLPTFDAPPAVDYFQWEALYRAEGLYPEELYAKEPFDDEAVLEGLQKGELFLAPIDAMEAFNLHGGSHAGALPQVDDPADLEFTSLPRAATLALDPKTFHPVLTRPSFSFREDWVWALTATTHAGDTAYRFVQFIWRPEIHARECEALGMLPLQPDVVRERVSRFRLDWMSHVFEAGLAQSMQGEPVPPAMIDKGLGSVYAQLWTKIVAGEIPPVPLSGIIDALHAPPQPKPLAVVTAADKSPEPATHADEPAPPPPENEDWESDAVFEPSGSGAKR